MNEPYLITVQGTWGNGRGKVFTPSLTLIFNGIDPQALGAASEALFTPIIGRSTNGLVFFQNLFLDTVHKRKSYIQTERENEMFTFSRIKLDARA